MWWAPSRTWRTSGLVLPNTLQSLRSIRDSSQRSDYKVFIWYYGWTNMSWTLYMPFDRLCYRPRGLLQHDTITDWLQRVLNAAACLASGTRKYDRGLSQILHADLHWLDVADRVRYKLAVTVHRCHTQQSAKVPGRLLRRCLRHRRSSATALSALSPERLATSSTQYTRPSRIFCRWADRLERVPDELRDNPEDSSFRQSLKHCSSASTSVPY